MSLVSERFSRIQPFNTLMLETVLHSVGAPIGTSLGSVLTDLAGSSLPFRTKIDGLALPGQCIGTYLNASAFSLKEVKTALTALGSTSCALSTVCERVG